MMTLPSECTSHFYFWNNCRPVSGKEFLLYEATKRFFLLM